MASTQTVKSELLLNACGYFIAADPSAILFVQPSQGAAESFSKERFSTMGAATPILRGLVATPASRLSDCTIAHKTFPGGSLDFVGANAHTDLASRPKRIILADEIDKYPQSAGNEGDPLKLAEERASTYKNIGRAKFIRTCSPTDKGTSRIDREFRFSDMRKLFVVCPHCGRAQMLTWKQVKFKDENGVSVPEIAGIECEQCGVKWTETERREALAALEFAPAYGWRQTANFTCCDEEQHAQQWDDEGRSLCMHCGERSPYAGHAGFHISKLYSIRHRLSDVVKEFLEAKGEAELLRKWTNTALAECWEDQAGEGFDGNGLPARAEHYTPDSLPLGVELISGSIDTQDDRLEIFWHGSGRHCELWAVDYEILHGDPAQSWLWSSLVLTRQFRRIDGKILPCQVVAIDSGGHFTSQVYAFASQRARIFACKGSGVSSTPIWPPRAKASHIKKPFHLVGVSAAKEAIYHSLKIAPNPDGSPTPGCIHFPRGEKFSLEYFDQLTSERCETRFRFGQATTHWILPSGKRNEALDTFVLAYAVRGALPREIQVAMSAVRPQIATPAAVRLTIPVEHYTAPPPPEPERPAWLDENGRAKALPTARGFLPEAKGWFTKGERW